MVIRQQEGDTRLGADVASCRDDGKVQRDETRRGSGRMLHGSCRDPRAVVMKIAPSRRKRTGCCGAAH